MKKKTIFITVVAVAVLVVAGKGLLSKRKSQMENDILPSDQTHLVPVVKAKQGVLKNEVPFLAQVLSDKSIKLSTKLAGYVEKVLVEESQKVKKGEVLVRIDAIELRSSIDALKVTLKAQESDLLLVKSIYARNKKLLAIGGLSKEQLTTSQVALKIKASALENTKQKIAQLEHQLSYLKIVAPFDGEIDAIHLNEGDLAASGKAILSMSNGKKKLLFSYTPTRQAFIKKEQDVLMNGEQIGYVKSIYTTSQNGLVSAEVTLGKEIVYPVGASVNIAVLTAEAKGCILPATTLLHKKKGTFVMGYENGKFTPLKVEVKMQSGESVMVSPCPMVSIAQASEVKLAALPAYNKVEVTKADNE
jgi:RND family efflux transporter MFP subunit